ncbi:MAG: hypothetical protein Fur0044_08470 [Anaerolineae bacterium]
MKIILTLNQTTPGLKHLWRSALMLALLTLLCWSFPAAQAAPGDGDTSFAGFDGDGILNILSVRMAGTFHEGGMALQPNGNIVMVKYRAGDGLMNVDRYLPNGQPDSTFGNNGSVRVLFPLGIVIRPMDVAVQADGKIVVAGRNTANINDAGSDFLLLRLTSTGEVDSSFGNGGYVITGFGNHRDCAMKVLIQPDGKIVAAGLAFPGDFDDFAVARYMPDGTLDNTFDSDGKVTVGFGGDDQAYDMALLNDGRLVVVGLNRNFEGLGSGTIQDDFAVLSLNPNGTPDNTFGGGDGKLTTGFGGNETATAVAVQADGRIVVLGNNKGSHKSHLARYMPNGTLDNSLDGDGKLTIPTDVLTDMALLPDGRIMAFGYSPGSAGNDKFAFRRLNPNGSPDTSFNNGGVLWLDLDDGNVSDRGTDIALLPDGRILGFGGSGSPDFYDKLWLVRLWPDGTSDTGGQQTHSLTFAPTYRPGYPETVYGFGTNGSAFIFGPDPFRAATAIAVQPDGKIVIAGYIAYNQEHTAMDFMVARFLPSGGIDFNFGAGGVTTIDFVGGADKATALALTPDGKIIVAGPVEGTRFIWGVVRLTASGQLDNSFNQGGKAYVDFNGDNAVSAVLVQPDGKIILGGFFNGDFALHRLLENGPSDPGFGSNGDGYSVTNLGGAEAINALALAPNGWIYAAGYRTTKTGNTTNSDMALAQYSPQGILTACDDPNNCHIWPSGTFFFDQALNDYAYALDLRADGQLVAAGCSNQHFAAVQVRTDGEPTPRPFNTDFVGLPDCASAVKFSGANKILLAGAHYLDGSDNNIALARFETTANTPGPNPTPTPNPNPSLGRVYLPIIMR